MRLYLQAVVAMDPAREEDFRRLKGSITGKALIEAVQASPHRDIDIEPRRTPMPVRDVTP